MLTRSYHIMHIYSDMLASYLAISFSPPGEYLIFTNLVVDHMRCGKIMAPTQWYTRRMVTCSAPCPDCLCIKCTGSISYIILSAKVQMLIRFHKASAEFSEDMIT